MPVVNASAASGNHSDSAMLAEERTAVEQCSGSFPVAEGHGPRVPHDAGRIALSVPPSPHRQRRAAGQPASLSPHLCKRYDSRRCQPARADAFDGTRAHSDHDALHSAHAPRRLRRIRARRRTDRQARTTATGMKRAPHPLEEALQARVRLLATTLRPATAAHYYQTVRAFLAFLREAFPQVRRASDLRRDPHLLSWLEHLWMRRLSSGKPLSNPSRAAYLIRLRRLLELLAD